MVADRRGKKRLEEKADARNALSALLSMDAKAVASALGEDSELSKRAFALLSDAAGKRAAPRPVRNLEGAGSAIRQEALALMGSPFNDKAKRRFGELLEKDPQLAECGIFSAACFRLSEMSRSSFDWPGHLIDLGLSPTGADLEGLMKLAAKREDLLQERRFAIASCLAAKASPDPLSAEKKLGQSGFLFRDEAGKPSLAWTLDSMLSMSSRMRRQSFPSFVWNAYAWLAESGCAYPEVSSERSHYDREFWQLVVEDGLADPNGMAAEQVESRAAKIRCVEKMSAAGWIKRGLVEFPDCLRASCSPKVGDAMSVPPSVAFCTNADADETFAEVLDVLRRCEEGRKISPIADDGRSAVFHLNSRLFDPGSKEEESALREAFRRALFDWGDSPDWIVPLPRPGLSANKFVDGLLLSAREEANVGSVSGKVVSRPGRAGL